MLETAHRSQGRPLHFKLLDAQRSLDFMRRSGDRTDETPQDDQGDRAMEEPGLPREGHAPQQPHGAVAGVAA